MDTSSSSHTDSDTDGDTITVTQIKLSGLTNQLLLELLIQNTNHRNIRIYHANGYVADQAEQMLWM